MKETIRRRPVCWPGLQFSCASGRVRHVAGVARYEGGLARPLFVRRECLSAAAQQVCVRCGATLGASNDRVACFDREVRLCPECTDRSREQVGRDHDTAELGGHK
jgi:hypothetical protein